MKDDDGRPDPVRAAIADAILQTTEAERDRARCLEVLESMSAEERALSQQLEAADRKRREVGQELDATQQREAALRADTEHTEAAQDAARAEIRSLQRQLARLADDERLSAGNLATLEARTARACTSAAEARDRVIRVSYKLTRDETIEHGNE